MFKRFAGLLFSLVAAHHVMVLLHEWAHGMAAWLIGQKSSPFAIHYGNWTLLYADEEVDYNPLINSDTPWRASAVAAPALVVNILLYAMSIKAAMTSVRRGPFLSQLTFWFAVFNLAELYSYMPLRAFSPGGDIGHINAGLRLPPWLLFVLTTPLIAWHLVRLLGVSLPALWKTLPVRTRGGRMAYGALVITVIFGLYGIAPIFYYGVPDPRSRWSFASLALGIVLFVAFSRAWAEASASEDNH